MVDEAAEVVAGVGGVAVDLAIFAFGGGPDVPAVGFFEDEGVLFAFEGGFVGAVLFEAVEVFEEEEPGGLLGVVELGGAARLFPENVVDILEGLLKHVGVAGQ